MPQTRSRGTRASVVKPEVMGQVAGFLDELPDKPKEQLSLKEAIAQLHEPIQAAFDKGYSYDETANILRDHGIQISAFTLKSYVPRGRKQTGKKPTTTRKPRKSAEPAQVDDQAPEEPMDQAPVVQEPVVNEAEEAPETPKRGATKGTRSKSSSTSQTRTRKTASEDETAPTRTSTGTRTRKQKTT